MIAKPLTQTQAKREFTKNNKYILKFVEILKGRIDLLEREIKELQKAKCIICGQQLHNSNDSGYCNNCYIHSPQYLIYQRNVQRKLYHHNPKNKIRVKKYQEKNKAKRKKYMKEYMKNNRARMNELKREWASKPENKAKREKYMKEYRKKK